MDGINPDVAPSGTGCVDCNAASPAGWWYHLRRCAECGHIGCCDTSPSQHATAHNVATGHPVIRSFEPGETWFWNYATQEKFADGPALVAPISKPVDQPAPFPTDRLPADWENYLHR
ncbi:UBP-type zinc finger domain-containing protein [Amycolatopsis sp. NPDC004368]